MNKIHYSKQCSVYFYLVESSCETDDVTDLHYTHSIVLHMVYTGHVKNEYGVVLYCVMSYCCVAPCHAISCHVMWYHVMSYHVASCHMLCNVMPCRVVSCHAAL